MTNGFFSFRYQFFCIRGCTAAGRRAKTEAIRSGINQIFGQSFLKSKFQNLVESFLNVLHNFLRRSNPESSDLRIYYFDGLSFRTGTLIILLTNINQHRRGDSQAWSTAIDSRSILAGVRRFKSGSPHLFLTFTSKSVFQSSFGIHHV